MIYSLHILTISLWEWENIKEINLKNIYKSGPYQEACEAVTRADELIPELKKAIELLKNKQQ